MSKNWHRIVSAAIAVAAASCLTTLTTGPANASAGTTGPANQVGAGSDTESLI
jgi:hypothetical protein